jgi:hypothetical protein
MTDGSATTADGSATTADVRRFIPVTLFLPLFAAVLGIDGGPIFQILAVEDLDLSPTAIGIAFGFGIVSVPIQLYAARTPLHRARRNTQWFLVVAAVQAGILAVLVAAGVTGPAASTALVVTVTAEIALSVLFATAWQPLLSWSVDTRQRQRLNATWPAAARGLLAGLLVLFAALSGPGRAVFIAVVGLVAAACALGLQRVPDPPQSLDEPATVHHGQLRSRVPLSSETRAILVVFAAVNIGALPLWLVYLDTVLWPTANLGVVAGVQTAASMIALLAWRPTDGDIAMRALVASVALLVAAVAIPLVGNSVDTGAAQATVLAISAVIGATGTTIRVAMLETAHRTVRPANSVRAFTILDVIASTSLQAGLLAGGFLIAASSTSTWPIDPYLSFVIASSAAAVIAVHLTARRATRLTTR